MGWQDRSYYRDRNYGRSNPLAWLSGSVSLGTWFGIQVRMHASMVLFIGLTLLFRGVGTWQDTLTSMGLLFTIVLLHEFGHCFGSRMVGGTPTEILMHPFGGLASAGAPHRPWANFITVMAGPMVNVLICLLMTVGMMIVAGTWRVLPWNPFAMDIKALKNVDNSPLTFYFMYWVFLISYGLLLFNLWPIFPLDGGQMLQSVLWAKIGYYKTTYFAAVTGIIGAVVAGCYGLVRGNWLLIILAFMGFQVSLNKYRELKANGPWAYEDDLDYGLGRSVPSSRLSARSMRKAQKLEREAAAEQERIDAILAKVSAQGMQSLTWFERRALRKATEHQRQRDVELAKPRRY